MSRLACRLAVAALLASFAGAAAPAAAQQPAMAAATEAIVPRPEASPLGWLAVELKPGDDARALLAPREQRRLADARRRLELQSAFSSDAELDRVFERMRKVVRASYVTLYRETLQRKRSSGGSRTVRSRDEAETAPSWRPRLEPRLTLGDHGCVSARLTLPHSRPAFVQRLGLEARHGYGGGETGLALHYRDGERRTFRLERTTGDPTTGERLSASVALRF